MDAKELRIGNWYEGSKGIQSQVTPDIYMNWEVNGCWAKPIPLTEERLQEFGWEPCGSYVNAVTWHLDVLEAFSILKYYNGKMWLVDIEMNEIIELKYVHQLQNLYFALTNEELKIKQLCNT